MDRRLYALTEQGEEKWKYDLEGEVDRDGIVTSSPTLGSDGTIYVGSTDQHVYAILPNCEGGELFSQVEERGALGEDVTRRVFRQIMTGA